MPKISRLPAPERLPGTLLPGRLSRMPRTPPPPGEGVPSLKGVSVIRRGTALVKDVKGSPDRPGIVSWKQGLYWISVLPPYRKGKKVEILYSKKPPPLAKIRKGKPGETIYTWRGEPPEELTIELGIFESTVTRGEKIAFARTRPRAKATLESSPKRIAGIRKARYKKNQPPPPEELLYKD